MRTSSIHYRVWLSLLLSLSLVTAFSLSSFAALEASETTDEAITDSLLVSQAPTGTLTAKGPVLINGNEAKTGATVTNGSVLQTQSGGHAIIELGAAGRVELDPITAITLTWTDNSIQATLNKCGVGVTLILPAGVTGLVKILHVTDVGVFSERTETDVRCMRGQALVKYDRDKEKTLQAGDHKEFDNAIEVTATGDAVFKVYCIEDHFPVFLLAGLAAIAIPFQGDTPPILSQLTP